MNLFWRPLSAASPAEFWRYWNPVYSYVLTFFVYRRLRRRMHAHLASFLTFLFCGFALHDVPGWLITQRRHPPFMTVLFAVWGAGAVASDMAGFAIPRRRLTARCLTNATYLVGGFEIARLLITA